MNCPYNLRIRIPKLCEWCIESHISGEQQCYDCIQTKKERLRGCRDTKNTDIGNMLLMINNFVVNTIGNILT